MSNNPSRRQFVAASAALSAAPYFIPASVLGKDGAVAPSNQIVMGLIGCGGMGKGDMGSLMKFEDCRFVAVCDVDASRRTDAAGIVNQKNNNQDCKAYKDFRELVSRPDLDAVVVATPDHWHALTALAAIRSGKDVYGEKPITHTFEEGRALAGAVAQHKRIWQTGSQQRSSFNFRWGVELVLNGHIGKLRHVEVGLPPGSPGGVKPVQMPPAELDYDLWCGPSPVLPYIPERVHYHWRWVLQYGGGQLMDWIGHHNDIAHWGMGMDHSGPAQVMGVGQFPPEGDVFNAATHYMIHCAYPNGVTSTISNRNTMGTRWIGDSGWVYVDRGKFEASNPQWTQKEFDRGPIKAYQSEHHHRNFLDCVKSRRPTICPAETSHRSITPGHLGLVSMLTGRKLKWDPAAEKIIGDDAAQAMLAFKPRGEWKL